MLLGRRKMKMRLLRVKDENSQAGDKLGFSRGTWDAVRVGKGSVVTFFFPWEAGSPGEVGAGCWGLHSAGSQGRGSAWHTHREEGTCAFLRCL